jgi:monoamine oxidase
VFGISDERYKIKGGNGQLTDALYGAVKNQVTLDHKLVAIREKAGKPLRAYLRENGGSRTDVTCEVLVLTIPFTMLRQVDIGVTLPPWKKQAIRELGYGTNAKLMIGFKERTWRKQNYTGYVFSDTPVQSGWDNSQLQPGQAGGYTVYTGGKQGVALGAGSPASQLGHYLPSLDAIWPGTAKGHNGQVYRMHWPTHPHTLASYGCYRPGQWTTIAGNEIRRTGNIYYAGEHCSLEYQGYMNGAAETGRIAAEQIIAGKGARVAAAALAGAVRGVSVSKYFTRETGCMNRPWLRLPGVTAGFCPFFRRCACRRRSHNQGGANRVKSRQRGGPFPPFSQSFMQDSVLYFAGIVLVAGLLLYRVFTRNARRPQ